MPLNEADTRAKLIDPALHSSGWTEDSIRREVTAGAIEIEEKDYDLKAVNPNRVEVVDTRTPEELLDIIEQKGKELEKVLAKLRSL